MVGRIEGRRKRRGHRMRWLDGITNSMDMSVNELWEMVKNREVWHTTVHEVTNMTEQLKNSKFKVLQRKNIEI